MQKKLMILGGSHYIRPLIIEAHKLGIYVITCDYLPDNYAHSISDKYINISVIDKEAVLKAAIEEKIDGISAFACDAAVVTAAYVAEKMGLPNVGPLESVEILQNKDLFRSFLLDNGFNAPKFKKYSSAKEALEDAFPFDYPVIVKPTDSCGSKGVTKVGKPEEYEKAVLTAFENSIYGHIIVEEFIEKVGCSSDADCFSIDGKMVFYSFSSQFFDEESNNPYTPSGYYWPSTMPEDAIEDLKKQIQRLISLLGMKTAVYNIESRLAKNGKTYLMEVSPRGGGNRLSEMAELVYGATIIQNHVRMCVGLPLVPMQKKTDNLIAEAILHSNKEGIFSAVALSKSIEKHVIEKDLWVDVGDAVESFSGANKTIGTLVLEFDSVEQMAFFTRDLSEHIEVVVDHE